MVRQCCLLNEYAAVPQLVEALFGRQPAGSPGLQVRTLSVALFTRPRPVMPGVVFFVSREVLSRCLSFREGDPTHTMLCLINFLFIVPVNVYYRSEKAGSYAVSTFSLRQNLQLAVAESAVGYDITMTYNESCSFGPFKNCKIRAIF